MTPADLAAAEEVLRLLSENEALLARSPGFRNVAPSPLATAAEALARAVLAAPVATWRKEPPTPAEVRAHQWWWVGGGVTSFVLQLDLDVAGIVTARDGLPLIVEDWGDRWSPCLPPAEEVQS